MTSVPVGRVARGSIQKFGKSPQFNVALPFGIHEGVQKYALEHGMTVSAVIRAATIQFINKENRRVSQEG